MAIRIAGNTGDLSENKENRPGSSVGGPKLAIQIGKQGRGRRSRRSHAKKPDAHHEILDGREAGGWLPRALAGPALDPMRKRPARLRPTWRRESCGLRLRSAPTIAAAPGSTRSSKARRGVRRRLPRSFPSSHDPSPPLLFVSSNWSTIHQVDPPHPRLRQPCYAHRQPRFHHFELAPCQLHVAGGEGKVLAKPLSKSAKPCSSRRSRPPSGSLIV